MSPLGFAPYDLTSKTCPALVDANNNSKETVAMLKFFPMLLFFNYFLAIANLLYGMMNTPFGLKLFILQYVSSTSLEISS